MRAPSAALRRLSAPRVAVFSCARPPSRQLSGRPHPCGQLSPRRYALLQARSLCSAGLDSRTCSAGRSLELLAARRRAGVRPSSSSRCAPSSPLGGLAALAACRLTRVARHRPAGFRVFIRKQRPCARPGFHASLAPLSKSLRPASMPAEAHLLPRPSPSERVSQLSRSSDASDDPPSVIPAPSDRPVAHEARTPNPTSHHAPASGRSPGPSAHLPIATLPLPLPLRVQRHGGSRQNQLHDQSLRTLVQPFDVQLITDQVYHPLRRNQHSGQPSNELSPHRIPPFPPPYFIRRKNSPSSDRSSPTSFEISSTPLTRLTNHTLIIRSPLQTR